MFRRIARVVSKTARLGARGVVATSTRVSNLANNGLTVVENNLDKRLESHAVSDTESATQ